MNIRSITPAFVLAIALAVPAFAANGAMNMDMDHAANGQPATTMDHANMTEGDHAMKMDSAQVFTGNGTVVSVDAAAKKIVLAHAPIAALGWPAMTMGFAVEDPSLLSGLQQGQKVRFDFRTQNNAAVIVDIEPLN